jgi:uncharacterized membrane protein
MAPEQATGRNDDIDARTDIFAFGAIVFEMLAGRPPFLGDTLASVIHAVVYAPTPSLRELAPETPPAIVAAVERALAKSRDERFPDVGGFVKAVTARSVETAPTMAAAAPATRPAAPPAVATERVARRSPFPVVPALLGVALLVSKGTLSFDLSGNAIGDLMIIVCAFLWSVYSIYGKNIASKYDPLTVLNYLFIIGTICLLPFYFLTPHVPVTAIPMDALAAIVFLALFCSIIAYLVYNIALERMDASRVALYIYFVPLSTIVLAWLILGETMTMASLGGGLMVLLGMYLAEIKS